MTWTKLGTEFADECAAADLSDAAFRTHVEAIGWLYQVQEYDGFIGRRMVRRFAGTDRPDSAVSELIAAGFWSETSTGYRVLHHAEIVRQSLAAQVAKRDRDRRAQDGKRKRDQGKSPERASADVSADGGTDLSGVVSGDTDRQTDSHDSEQSSFPDGDSWSSCWGPVALPGSPGQYRCSGSALDSRCAACPETTSPALNGAGARIPTQKG